MSEAGRYREVEPTVETIAGSIEQWLMKEVGSSVVGRNQVLDDFNDWHRSLSLPYNHPANVNARKNKNHYSQLMNWTNGLVEHYDDFRQEQADYTLARQMFRAQMYLSGLFRVSCFMQAVDQEEYYRRRLESEHIGLNVDPRMEIWHSFYRLYDYIPDETAVFRPVLTLPELTNRTLELNERQREYVKRLHEGGKDDIGKEESPTMDMIIDMENGWLGHLVDYIAFTASERRGQLAAVPFLEPKSISEDPQPYYPFAESQAA